MSILRHVKLVYFHAVVDDHVGFMLRFVSKRALLEDIIEDQLRLAVVPAVRTLVVQSPVVGKIFNFVFAACREFAN